MKRPEAAKLPVSENILSVPMKTRSSLHYKKKGEFLKTASSLKRRKQKKKKSLQHFFTACCRDQEVNCRNTNFTSMSRDSRLAKSLIGCSAKPISAREEKQRKKGNAPSTCRSRFHDFSHFEHLFFISSSIFTSPPAPLVTCSG